ncbi:MULTISPECIES: hypothetical protein [Gluconobacter]|uniref:Uncharacterized protein n=1 Tax=Gluconobacter cerinus TaxID=38307 RepID=A0AAV5NA86_9PROT|nr:hypothetical protein [Gluconobacter cerinus]MBS1034963.1 hypothetical protein [Gluconobacter cerinus]GBR02841.1 hypothetical protein AA0229_1798 [Gluconobacter cerinus NRIC 0229]GLQ61469.1 hypothetical protein GCM10007867_03140 [Gluconobacter cerinus]
MSFDSQYFSKETNRMKTMDNSGGGETLCLAVAGALVAIVGTILVKIYRYNAETNYPHSNPSETGTSSSVAETQVRFAAVVEAQLLRETGQSPDKAEKLFSDASMRWAGSEAKWNDNTNQMGVLPLSECPEEDGKDVIVTFTSSLPEYKIPTNRLDMCSCVENAAVEKKLVFSGFYNCPLVLNPTHFGFLEG